MLHNLKDFRNTNFNAFCVLGAVNNSNQPKQVIKKLQEEWEDVKFLNLSVRDNFSTF